MANGLLRVGIVGASSLLGKELAEELTDSQLGVVDLILLEEDVDGAQVTAVGDEPSLIQQIGRNRSRECRFASLRGAWRRRGNIGR